MLIIIILTKLKEQYFLGHSPPNSPRKYESAHNRLRIGHTYTHLTHSFLIKNEDPPYMLTLCGTPHGQTRSY